MKKTQVLIVGAGPTGLVLALFLARAGVTPRIIDKKAGTGRESRALGVQARTLEFYRQLDFADEVVSQGVPIQEIYIRENGRVANQLNVHRFGEGLSPYPFVLCFPQDAHETLLVEKLKSAGVGVEWETELLSMQQTSAGVQATVRRAGGNAEPCRVDYLCGCDGGRSQVRQSLELGFAGGTSDKTYFVADVEACGEATSDALAKQAFSFCLNTEDFMLVLPARNTGTHRLIGLIPEKLEGKENIGFENVRPMTEKATGVHIDKINWFSTYRVHHRVADHFRVGRAFVVGDAGHIHSPLGGQGMNTGIGDAVNLAWKLAAVLQDRADVSILDTYETERLPFARLLVSTTDRAFQWVNGSGIGHRFVRQIFFRLLLPRLVSFAATRRLIFRRISQSLVNYRASALSQGGAGKVRGGDRLPWVLMAGERDNFAPLKSLDWQLHVYGAADGDLRSVAEKAGLPIHTFAWTLAMKEAGLQRDAFYLIRPDGYVAVVAERGDAEQMQEFLTRFKILPRRAAEVRVLSQPSGAPITA